ncbi:hypothetical protein DLAC_01132 [Tieghemostelium lacteum]|uniref:Transcription and mRNA export factor ENY2 n=1 Tax=Tieghemostelium lacteum TaxID=361077 RepID=A0A152A7T5_TIELA|nr:hypothetical protein DLAC_01132 [Tieghemostelium lacteum]|eukprot:KYR02300.1 hypothetical protein DLAC_01132 [Tieghemostelium lacteum]
MSVSLSISHIKLRSTIHQRMIESGERERLKLLLKNKLVEGGWRDEVKTLCREYIKNNENVKLSDLCASITPQAKKKVPPQIKQDLTKRIRKFLGPIQNQSVTPNNVQSPMKS